jgi:nitrate reductase assembly molybdenum cofactor insertion protein NarJ
LEKRKEYHDSRTKRQRNSFGIASIQAVMAARQRKKKSLYYYHVTANLCSSIDQLLEQESHNKKKKQYKFIIGEKEQEISD